MKSLTDIEAYIDTYAEALELFKILSSFSDEDYWCSEKEWDKGAYMQIIVDSKVINIYNNLIDRE